VIVEKRRDFLSCRCLIERDLLEHSSRLQLGGRRSNSRGGHLISDIVADRLRSVQWLIRPDKFEADAGICTSIYSSHQSLSSRALTSTP
jgi:hypothetical protein